MIYYTLRGFQSRLEFHENKIILSPNLLANLIFFRKKKKSWNLNHLSKFVVVKKKVLFYGKIEWQNFDGEEGSFYYSTSHAMIEKIETYLQKIVVKNKKIKMDQPDHNQVAA